MDRTLHQGFAIGIKLEDGDAVVPTVGGVYEATLRINMDGGAGVEAHVIEWQGG